MTEAVVAVDDNERNLGFGWAVLQEEAPLARIVHERDFLLGGRHSGEGLQGRALRLRRLPFGVVDRVDARRPGLEGGGKPVLIHDGRPFRTGPGAAGLVRLNDGKHGTRGGLLNQGNAHGKGFGFGVHPHDHAPQHRCRRVRVVHVDLKDDLRVFLDFDGCRFALALDGDEAGAAGVIGRPVQVPGGDASGKNCSRRQGRQAEKQ